MAIRKLNRIFYGEQRRQKKKTVENIVDMIEGWRGCGKKGEKGVCSANKFSHVNKHDRCTFGCIFSASDEVFSRFAFVGAHRRGAKATPLSMWFRFGHFSLSPIASLSKGIRSVW